MKVICGVVLVVFSLLSFAETSSAAYCSGSPDEGERTSEFPIMDTPPVFVREVANAKLYEAGPENARFDVVHVWGTPYEMGFAQGTLLKDTVRGFMFGLWKFLNDEIMEIFERGMLPEWAQRMIAEEGMERALDWTIDKTGPFTPQDYLDEMKGLADATGVPYDMIYRINMFPELTKASCSFFGAWGKAVGKEGHSYQLRALDFDTSPMFTDYQQVIVYHPNEGNAWAQVSWPGNVGVLTGISSERMAISEIGVSYPDDSFGQGTENTGPERVRGEPWMFVLRDTLQFTNDLNAGIENIENSNRTCNLIIGLGDGELNMVNGIEYSGYVAIPYDDDTQLPVNDTWHPKIDDIVYNGMDWLCPDYTQVLGEQLSKYYSEITEEIVVKNILPTVQTGDLHAAVYDLTDNLMHISFCRKSTADENEPHYAYERQFTRLHMNEIFAETAPTPTSATSAITSTSNKA